MSPTALDMSSEPTSNGTDASSLLAAVYAAPDGQACAAASRALGEHVQRSGLRTLFDQQILVDLVRASKSKSGFEREGAMVAMGALATTLGPSSGVDPFLLDLMPVIMERYQESGQGVVVREAAEAAAESILRLPPPELAPKAIEKLWEIIEAPGVKWRTKQGALDLLAKFPARAREQVAERLGEYIPRLTPHLQDTKSEVSNSAKKAATAICGVLSNPDIQPFLPLLVSCMARPDTVPDAIKKLSSNVWVREVDGPTLAALQPVLVRALSDRSTTVQRQTVVLISNLYKVVRQPDLAAIHFPVLFPGVCRIADGAAFPEIRDFANEARGTLLKATGGEEKARQRAAEAEDQALNDEALAVKLLGALVEKEIGGKLAEDVPLEKEVAYVASGLKSLARRRDFDEETWREKYVKVYLGPLIGERLAEGVAREIRNKWLEIDKVRHAKNVVDDDDEGGAEPIVDLQFSLAYGGLLLLNHTNLKLRRGHRYGLCGANGAGKSTLLRAINRHQIEGFPSDRVSTFYVEHDIDGEDSGASVFDFMVADRFVSKITSDKKKIADTLQEMGFDEDRQKTPVGALSGGWKMRLALARAMICRADLLLLDEPTNHLDVGSVRWLEQYLIAQKEVTVLVVSHDSGFLDAICTDIIHYETKQLVYYKGNLAKFVERHPAAQTYYTLAASTVKFTFPPPGSLMGVRSQTRAILKATNCTFTYPNAPKPSLHNASCALSLSSRVGVVGPNGAGKSTLIKLLTGDTVPDSGKIDKHPNLRIAHVAQHAFHHLEQHLEKTAVQYIQWRYDTGHDKELSQKATRALTAEEKAQMETPITANTGEQRKVESIMGRQKQKKSYAYEIKWVGLDHKFNTWIPRERLIELGFNKLVATFDDYEASREGSGTRETSAKVVKQHLEELGLDGDLAMYNAVEGLSGGQKVKVVLGAAMWSKPQLLILDEPTNFLDRESLAGLANAIREWSGAFVVISHNEEFVGALCPEIWNVEAGILTKKGKVNIVEDAFDKPSSKASSKPNTAPSTAPSTAPGTAPGSAVNSDDERAGETVEGTTLKLKAKKKKKLTKKQLKEQELRRRKRTLDWLSSSIPGTEREPDTESSGEE